MNFSSSVAVIILMGLFDKIFKKEEAPAPAAPAPKTEDSEKSNDAQGGSDNSRTTSSNSGANTSEERQALRGLPIGINIEINPIVDDSKINFTYLSRLVEFVADDELVILKPTYNTTSITLETDIDYGIVFKSDLGIFSDTVRVLDSFKQAGLAFIRIKLIGITTQNQRRKAYRLEEFIEFQYDVVEKTSSIQSVHQKVEIQDPKFKIFEKSNQERELEMLKLKKMMKTFRKRFETEKGSMHLPLKGETLNISSGGIKFVSTTKLNRGDIISLYFYINHSSVLALGTIIFTEDLKPYDDTYISDDYECDADCQEDAFGRYSYKCRFEMISDADREVFVQYIMRIQHQQTQIEAGGNSKTLKYLHQQKPPGH